MEKRHYTILASCLSWLLFLVTPAMAVDDYGIFELEQGLGTANAIEESAVGPDWETLCDPDGDKVCQNGPDSTPAGSNVFSGIIEDLEENPDGILVEKSIFGGGNKDIHDVSSWSWVEGTVPDKSDILHAAAAAYNYNDDLVIYYTADRFANSGDTFMGFWFFQAEVSAPGEGGGNFVGEHINGDVLVLVNFPQASNAYPAVKVLEWDDSCARKASNDPAIGECAATNLKLRASNTADGAVCVSNGVYDQDACANTNNGDSYAPWNYMSKDGNTMFPYETFFEGGINISRLLPEAECFATFMAETRSSSSYTAQLKDFVIGDFPLCGINVAKACYANTPNVGPTAGSTTYTYDVAGCIENDGFGKVKNLSLVDDPAFDLDTLEFWTVSEFATVPTAADCGAGAITNQGNIVALNNAKGTEIADPANYELVAGEKVLWFAQFTSSDNAATDIVTASVTTLSGTAIPVATDDALCPTGDFVPGLAVTKNCDAGLVSLDVSGGGTVSAVEVEICGAVSNPGEVRLLAVSVSDNHAGTVYTSSSLADKGSAGYTGSYYPSGVTSTLPPYNFSDEVTAVGYVEAELIGGSKPSYCEEVALAAGNAAGLPAGLYFACTVTDSATCDVCDTNTTCPIP